jgi:hypothetical protein
MWYECRDGNEKSKKVKKLFVEESELDGRQNPGEDHKRQSPDSTFVIINHSYHILSRVTPRRE